jgi:hypothetical protein
MYPNNQDIEVFGEQVSWPGVDANGKFTNGSFSDPMVKPSFIPAETINLILDNLESVIGKCGETPNATDAAQIAKLITPLVQSKTIVMRDEHGRAKMAAPKEDDDIARLADIITLLKKMSDGITPDGYGSYLPGRNLMAVLGVSTIPEAMAEIRRRCNNNGEIDNSKIPDFRGLMVGDYIDGLDFSGITPPTSEQAPSGGPQPWNDTYKNNQIVIAGFNTYKQSGNTENADNHILFVFRDVLWQQRQRATDDNTGGYAYNNAANEIRAYLEGLNGDGNGTFALKLEECLNGGVLPPGGKYLYTVRRLLSTKGGWGWNNYTVFLPSEHEVFGSPHWSEAGFGDGLAVQFPIYQRSTVYRCKCYNGARAVWWGDSPAESYATHFCGVHYHGAASCYKASIDVGVSPAFCVR